MSDPFESPLTTLNYYSDRYDKAVFAFMDSFKHSGYGKKYYPDEEWEMVEFYADMVDMAEGIYQDTVKRNFDSLIKEIGIQGLMSGTASIPKEFWVENP